MVLIDLGLGPKHHTKVGIPLKTKTKTKPNTFDCGGKIANGAVESDIAGVQLLVSVLITVLVRTG